VRKVALVACVKSKRAQPAPAADLYQSAWFRKARAYAKEEADAWYILSAKYGVVSPNEVIEPYDESLYDFSAGERREWAAGVMETLRELITAEDEVIILAGLRYREHLEEGLRQFAARVSVPMEGLGIGEQLRFLNEHTA
jgi:cytoplasmic iron level regulating protein YaaA (DUF328/UPF0246 family)